MNGSVVRNALTVLCMLLTACAVPPELKESRVLFNEGRAEAALKVLQAGMLKDPDNVELRATYFAQLERATAQWLAAGDAARLAGRADDARQLYQRVQIFDPGNARARDGLVAIAGSARNAKLIAEAQQSIARGQAAEADAALRRVLADDPTNSAARSAMQQVRELQFMNETAAPALKAAFAGPITLEFRDTPLRSVFDVISRTAGLNIVFDKDVRTDARVTIFIRNSPIEDVVRLILLTNQLERKALNDNSILIYPNTPQKAREYQELVVRSFFLANADVKQAQTMVRTVVKSQNIYVDEKLNIITVRDTADAVRLAERLIQTIDIAEPEVMLEVEVLEVSRTKLQEIGINFPAEISLESKLPIPIGTPPGRINLNQGPLIWTISNPALRINLLSQDGDVSILANPRIRAKNREKARIVIGERLPVFTSTAVPNAGVASSVSYIDVGLKLEVEPNVFLESEVGIKVALEVSNTLEKVRGPDGTEAYRIGTRNAQTNLRVRDGETQMLGGLINRNERQTLNKLPGLGDLPGVGRLFGSNGLQADNTEIVLLITPRIVRNLQPEGFELAALSAGTESAVGARPLSIRPTAPRALALSGSGAGTASRPGVPAAMVDPGKAPAPAVIELPLLAVALTAPDAVALGQDFAVTVQVPESLNGKSGEAVLAFNPAQLVIAGADNGRVVVPLSGGAGGVLSGTVGARILSTGSGVADLEVTEGTAQFADGAARSLGPGKISIRLGR